MDAESNNAAIGFLALVAVVLTVEAVVGFYAWRRGFNAEGIAAHCSAGVFAMGLCMMVFVIAHLKPEPETPPTPAEIAGE